MKMGDPLTAVSWDQLNNAVGVGIRVGGSWDQGIQ